jgi:hypothetical protein
MEKPPSFESKESVIDSLIEKLGEEEGMNAENILSDIVTFLELSQEDESAKGYLEEVAEKIGITIEEMMRYAAGKAK